MSTKIKRRLTASEKRWRWAAGILGALALSFGFGCDLASMSYFLNPFADDRIQPEVKLTPIKGKESRVVILASFANLETRPEFQTLDQELCERLAAEIKKRAAANKDKVKIIPYYEVKNYLNKQLDPHLVSKRDIGKHFNADYAVNLEINKMSLFEEGSYRQLYRGNTEIAITVFKMNQPEGEGPYYDGVYDRKYPKHGPDDTGTLLQFRNKFLACLAKELSRYFEAYPDDEKFDID
jgi:hypothetical protein